VVSFSSGDFGGVHLGGTGSSHGFGSSGHRGEFDGFHANFGGCAVLRFGRLSFPGRHSDPGNDFNLLAKVGWCGADYCIYGWVDALDPGDVYDALF
jgi:hypothetical protein